MTFDSLLTPGHEPVADTETRRSRRNGESSRPKRRRRIVLWVVLGIVALLIVGIAAAAWVGTRALEARASLVSAQEKIQTLQETAAAGDFAALAPLIDDIAVDTANARELTSDPIWRVGEIVPIAGRNLTVVRELADAVDSVVAEGIRPLTGLVEGGLDQFSPKDGRFDVALIADASTQLAASAEVFEAAGQQVAAIDATGTIGQVQEASGKLQTLFAKFVPMITEASSSLAILPAALGADGPRNYLMLFQNNAESLALGGNTAAWLILTVDDGALSISAQYNSTDFNGMAGTPPVLDPGVDEFFNGWLKWSQNTTLRPDFPTAAALSQGFLARAGGAPMNGVISMDPVALGYLLEATGPLTLENGSVLDSANAVPMLLSDVYTIFEEPADQDLFFAAAARGVFTALTGGAPDVRALIDSMSRAVDEHRFMLWSADPAEQERILASPLSGVLPTDNVDETTMGVFFVENSASKMSYYLKTSTVMSETCNADASTTFGSSVGLHLDISPEAYDALPAYVASGAYFTPKKTRTQVYVYGPPGTTFQDWSWDGTGLGSALIKTGTDLGRPVAQIQVDLQPGETSIVGATFTAPAGEKFGPLTSWITPMVNPTAVTLNDAGC